MRSYAFRSPMTKGEAVAGWLYFVIHAFLFTFIFAYIAAPILDSFGIKYTNADVNVAYYGIGAVFVFIALFKFMKRSFSSLCDHKGDTFTAIIMGYFLYNLAYYAVQLLLSFILADLVNPNSAAITSTAKVNPNAMIVVGVILAPIVEEVLFRGVVFGTVRRKNRILAYVACALAFSLYHLWESFLYGYHWTLFLYLLQYVPGSIILCWCYEKSKNIWCPIFLHAILNFVSLQITLNF